MAEKQCSSSGCTKESCEGCPSKNKPASFQVASNEYTKVKHVIGVVSGKGGVGKSMVTASLANLMAEKGYRVGILDADITGPSIPKMYGLHGPAQADDNGIYPPLAENDIKVMSINLLMPDEELTANNYTVVMINNPMQDLSKQEYETLQAYLDDGGRLLLNLSVNYPENMTNFDTLLARYGVSVEQGSLIDTNANYYYGYVNFLLPDLGDHDVTEDVSQKQVLVPMPIALKVEEDRNRATQITPILTTSDDAIVKKDKNSTVMDYEEGDVKGPFYVGLMVEESLSAGSEVKNTRIAVLGSSLMFDSQNYMTGANYDLLYNTLNYLQTEVDTLYISAKEYTTDTLTITEANMVGWSIVFVVAIPLALVVAGLVVWSRRKHL